MTSPVPDARWHDVRAHFEDLAITTFAVEPARLRARLPEDCVPEIAVLADGRERALVSAVSFRVRHFRLAGIPWLDASFLQVNYRAYVRAAGTSGVWFFASVATAPWHLGPRYLWRLPWHRATIDIDVEWETGRCRRYSLRQCSARGTAELEAIGAPATPLDGLDQSLLTEPLVGYCQRTNGRRAVYRVWHERLEATTATAKSARFEVFENLGLVDRGAAPHSVLVVRKTDFLVRLPPERGHNDEVLVAP